MLISLSFNYIPMWTVYCVEHACQRRTGIKKKNEWRKKYHFVALKIEIKIMYASNWINKFNFRKMILTSHFSPIVNKSGDNTRQITEKKCFALIISLLYVYVLNIYIVNGESRCVEFDIRILMLFKLLYAIILICCCIIVLNAVH